MKTSASQCAEAFLSLSDGGNDAGELASRFFAYLRSKRMLKRRRSVMRAIERLEEKRSGVLGISIVTAHPVADTERSFLEREAATFFPGSELRFRYMIDGSVLGGVRIASSDEMINATVRTRLRILEGSMQY